MFFLDLIPLKLQRKLNFLKQAVHEIHIISGKQYLTENFVELHNQESVIILEGWYLCIIMKELKWTQMKYIKLEMSGRVQSLKRK